MKNINTLFIVFFVLACVSVSPVFAIGVGSYKTETEYGLIDGFKWNFFNHDKETPLVQLKSETKEEQIRLEKEKLKPKEEQDENQLYRFMLENTTAF